jgi:galactokinase
MKLSKFKSGVIVKSPGRINLIGEHIDYNGGYVLPAAINLKTKLELQITKNTICSVTSENIGTFNFDIRKPLQKSSTQWHNYVLGVVDGLRKKCPEKLSGFHCSISSDIPIGSGVSSSAALECGLAKGLNILFDLSLSDNEIIDISHSAEHNFVGNKCGIMDQFSVIKGKFGKLILLNCESKKHQFIDANFSPYKIVLLNSNLSHNLASSEYNTRVIECEQALSVVQNQYPEYSFLADVPESLIRSLKGKMSGKIYQRALYVTRENKRTLKATELIQKGSIQDFGNLMYQTHQELSKNYEVSCAELDFLVDLTKDIDQVVGSRMMGGGFGGCTISLVNENFVNTFLALAKEKYKKKFGAELNSILVEISNGVEVFK